MIHPIKGIDKLFLNGSIQTLDQYHTTVEAVGISGERITALGSEKVLMDAAGPDVDIVDLEGDTLFPGLIDSHYRGEVKVAAVNLDASEPVTIARGDKIAQLVIQSVATVHLVETDELPRTQRGSGGFGSTGV